MAEVSAEHTRNLEEQATKQWAAGVNVPYFDTRAYKAGDELARKLDVTTLKDLPVAPISLTGGILSVGFTTQADQGQINQLPDRLKGFKLAYFVISPTGQQELISKLGIRRAEIVAPTPSGENFDEQLKSVHPKQFFQLIAQYAYSQNVSDIHIEPSKKNARLRFRIDGILHPVGEISRERYELLLSDIQTRGGTKWGLDEPQSGRLSLDLLDSHGATTTVSMRLETVPLLYGHDVVVRIFNIEVKYLNLDNFNLTPDQRTVINERIAKPHGLTLMVGPTGSGKTSMLYAIINQLITPALKIVTLEDPVEYEMGGISQVPVKSDDNEQFLQKLRAVLREDPDIIMIGEIRDSDTARTSLQAALTGHLVLSTFHASSTSAAISRLMDMVGQNPLLASAIRLLMAQRLVRRLCEVCKESYTPDAATVAMIHEHLAGLKSDPPKEGAITLFKAKGCDKCNNLGYKGRLLLIEQLIMTDELSKMISVGTEETTTQMIEAEAIKGGMITLIQDALVKVLAGETDLTEISRVIET
jgi:type II secretory ATPase GspE/PulE/Tfp pilus assembly ATPase PilB-like protein